MSYEFYITRARTHARGAQTPIPQEDWRAVIDGDPELVVPDGAVPDFAVWTGSRGRATLWIDWSDGNLCSRGPGTPAPALLDKLVELAGLLDAELRDASGHRYGTGQARPDEDDGDLGPEPLVREAREAERRLSPPLEEILDETGPKRDRPPSAGHVSFARERYATLPGRSKGGRGPDGDRAFSVGQRVRTSWGRPATVVSVDERGPGGGHVDIRYDDGRIATMSMASSGLRPL